MYCVGCQSKMKVDATHNIKEARGLTFRYRHCPNCGLVVETAEEVSRVIREGNLKPQQGNKDERN
jgi:transcriptional regulator NrdR family protein